MKMKVIAIFLIVVMMFNLTACTNSDNKATVSTTQSRIFTDDVGREVNIPADISRIVPSSSLAQIILFSIAPDMLAGLAFEWNKSAEGIISDAYLDLPCFGNLYASADLNVEELALTDPQIIIDIGESKETVSEDLDALYKQTLIPTVYISSNLESLSETYRTLGRLLNREEKGEELAQFCERIYSRTTEIMERVGANRVNTLYVLGEKGLNVLAAGSYPAEVLDMLTDNVAVVSNPISKGTGNEVTMEQISLWDPEFIIFGPDSIYNSVKEMETWNQLSAIVQNNYIKLPDAPHNWMSMPPSAQRYLCLIWLTAELYPEYCDYDVRTEIQEYFRLFYGCELTDVQYEALMAGAFRR